MSDFNGDHLLKIFGDLNVQLFNLSPNVVMGWFDTDEQSMKYLLRWMFNSLSSENVVSPLEHDE